jgi:serine protease Do
VIRGYLGIGLQELNQDLARSFGIKDAKGALISDVKEGSPAEQAGLKQGDVIIEYQGTSVEDGVALQRMVTRTSFGTKVSIKIIRDGREREMAVRIGEQPDETKTAKVERAETDAALSGLAVEELDQETAKELGVKGKRGVVVTRVEPDSGAERAGLLPGDVIREINRQPIGSMKDFEKVTSDVKKGGHVLILVNRRGNSLFLSAKV